MIEIKKEASDDYSFALKTEGGHTLLKSVMYSNREIIDEVVGSLPEIKRNRNTFERKTNHGGEFLFSLKNNKGELIGNSQLYQSEAGMENGIKNLIDRINSLADANLL